MSLCVVHSAPLDDRPGHLYSTRPEHLERRPHGLVQRILVQKLRSMRIIAIRQQLPIRTISQPESWFPKNHFKREAQPNPELWGDS